MDDSDIVLYKYFYSKLEEFRHHVGGEEVELFGHKESKRCYRDVQIVDD
uniref:Uncharacterized protein n=1 Tax=Tetranychus urticae TaxID=32264 RepID=T1K619_TETUR